MAPVRTIAVTNQKGGVGKTTTVANLGAALARRGLEVCLIDLDPQAHLTLHYGLDPSAPRKSIYDVLTGDATLAQAAVPVEPHLTVVPSVIDLAAEEVELASTVGREQILRDRMGGLACQLALIDCPPSLGLLTLNALSAADEVLIPLQPHFLALQGLGKLLETVALVQRRINPNLKVSGLVFCMYESSTRLAGEVVADVEKFFAAAGKTNSPWSQIRIFQTRIRRNIKLAECPSYGTTILRYDPSSHGAKDYTALAEEFLVSSADGAAGGGSKRDASRLETSVSPAPGSQAESPPHADSEAGAGASTALATALPSATTHSDDPSSPSPPRTNTGREQPVPPTQSAAT
jgi:chromosome partitioning protein